MFRTSCLVAALVSAGFSISFAQDGSGLLVVAHGAGPEWNTSVRATVSQVSWPHGPVEVAFLMGPEAESSGWDSAAARLARSGVTRVVVVPLMVSSFGGHYRQVEHYAGVRAEMPAELGRHGHHAQPLPVPAVVTRALDDASEIGAAIVERWQRLSERERSRPVLLVGHGPNDEADAERWTQNLAVHGERLRAAGLSRDFRVALLRDDAPAEIKSVAIAAMRDTLGALASRHGDSVLVMPIMIANGPIPQRGIPTHLAGLPWTAAPAGLTPHPAIARWIERVAAEGRCRGSGAGCRVGDPVYQRE